MSGDIDFVTVCTYPKNLAATGPISKTLAARASPSISGGMWLIRDGFKYLKQTTFIILSKFKIK